MIDPAKLTAENGFVDGFVDGVVDGVVVEYITEYNSGIFYFSKTRAGDMSLYCGSHGYIPFDDIISIRPLTGPMAVWNFAPEWATHCWIWESGDIWWFANDPTMSHGYASGNGYGETQERTFWARSEK